MTQVLPGIQTVDDIALIHLDVTLILLVMQITLKYKRKLKLKTLVYLCVKVRNH